MNICCSAYILQRKSEKRACWEHKRRSLMVTGRVREKPDKPKSIHHSKSDSIPDTALRSVYRRGRKRFQRWQADKKPLLSSWGAVIQSFWALWARDQRDGQRNERETRSYHPTPRGINREIRVCVEVCRCMKGSPDVVPHAVKSTNTVLDDYLTSDHQLSLTNDFWLLLGAWPHLHSLLIPCAAFGTIKRV